MIAGLVAILEMKQISSVRQGHAHRLTENRKTNVILDGVNLLPKKAEWYDLS